MLCGSRYAETDSYCPGAQCGTDLYAQRTGNPSYAVQAWCEPRELTAAPGETVTLTLTLRNAGTTPDRYDPNIPPETTRWLGLDRPDPSPVPPGGTRVWTLVYTLPPDAGTGGEVDIDIPIGVVSQTDARNAARAMFSLHVQGAATAVLAPVPAADAAGEDGDDEDASDDHNATRGRNVGTGRARRDSRRNPRVVLAIALAVALALVVALVVTFADGDGGGGSTSADAGRTSAASQSPTPGAQPVGQGPESSDPAASDSASPSASSSADMLTVPDVVGMPQAQGLAMLKTKGFQPTVTGTGDKIAATNPPAGKKVERDKPAITVTLAPAPSSAAPPPSSAAPPAVEMVAVPNVVDQSYAQAEGRLTAAGFAVARVEEVSSKPAGTVLRTDPTGGATVPKGSRVTVTVARLADNMTVVPNISMKRVSEAVPLVEAAGLHLEAPYDDPDAIYWSSCQLKDYSPSDGAVVEKGTTIDVKRTTGCG